MIAVQNRSFDYAKTLITKYKADVNTSDYGGDTPLMMSIDTRSIEMGSIEFIRFLVEHGADVNKHNCLRVTPLMKAIDCKSYEIALYLLDNKANVNDTDCRGQTPLMLLVESDFQEKYKLMQRMLNEPIDLNIIDNHGDDVLTLAEKSEDSKAILMLANYQPN